MEPVICSIYFNSIVESEVSFEVLSLTHTEVNHAACLIVSTAKFAPVHGYSIVDASKSVCLFIRNDKVYHNNIPKDDFVPLLVPLSEYKMFQLEFTVGDEFRFGVGDSIYSCVVKGVKSPKVFIEHDVDGNNKNVFNQLIQVSKKIPHLVPQRPMLQKCKSLPCICGMVNQIQNTLTKTTSSEDLLIQRNMVIDPPTLGQNEYDADRIFVRSFDYITGRVVWRLRDVNVHKLLIKFVNDTIRRNDTNTPLRVNLTLRNGEFIPLVYSSTEAFKFGVLVEVDNVASITFNHNGYDVLVSTVTVF
ncbi:hypothetical protein F-liban_119 [Faustovirus]|nr:hypothetical protein F-liban_119 [Faustovirus]